jgi:hypothetical protein
VLREQGWVVKPMATVVRLRDLLAGDELHGLVGSPEMDPLTEKDALQEARLNEVVLDVVNMRMGMLFDVRGALQLQMAYTGLSRAGRYATSQLEQRLTACSWRGVERRRLEAA